MNRILDENFTRYHQAKSPLSGSHLGPPVWLSVWLSIGALGGCADSPPGPFVARFQSDLDTGVMLSAWSDGDELIFAGGTLSLAPGRLPGTSGTLMRYRDGGLCQQTVADRPLWWIHGRPVSQSWGQSSGQSWGQSSGDSQHEFWAVGEQGLIVHGQGGVVRDESVPTEADLYGVWAAADAPIAVGGYPFSTGKGEVWRRVNGAWKLMASDLPGVAFKVWRDWIVGDGVAWQIDGARLIERFPPAGERLFTVTGRGDGEVFAVGGGNYPAMLRWDGSAWQTIEVPPECAFYGLNGVWTGPGQDVWVAGLFGGMGAFDGASWRCPETPLTQEHFHAVTGHAGQRWWVGGALLEAGGDRATIGRSGDAPLELSVSDCE